MAWGGVSLWGGAGRNGIELKGASLYVCIRRLTSAYVCMRLSVCIQFANCVWSLCFLISYFSLCFSSSSFNVCCFLDGFRKYKQSIIILC